MENNEKYYTDQQFEQMNICYIFCLYCNKRNADLQINCTNLMPWTNNNLTRDTAQNILMGMAAAATIKYKNPVAVLYADTPDGNRVKLGSCEA